MEPRVRPDYIHEARLAKARKLADHFISMGVDTDTISLLDDRGWRAISAICHVKPPSFTTQLMVVGLVGQAAVTQ